jgi:hypothetical protein
MRTPLQKGFVFDAVDEPVFRQAAPNRAVRALRKLFQGRPVTTEAIAAEMGRTECAAWRALGKGVKAGLVEQIGYRLGWKPAGAELVEDKGERRRRQYRESYHRRKTQKRRKPKPR